MVPWGSSSFSSPPHGSTTFLWWIPIGSSAREATTTFQWDSIFLDSPRLLALRELWMASIFSDPTTPSFSMAPPLLSMAPPLFPVELVAIGVLLLVFRWLPYFREATTHSSVDY